MSFPFTVPQFCVPNRPNGQHSTAVASWICSLWVILLACYIQRRRTCKRFEGTGRSLTSGIMTSIVARNWVNFKQQWLMTIDFGGAEAVTLDLWYMLLSGKILQQPSERQLRGDNIQSYGIQSSSPFWTLLIVPLFNGVWYSRCVFFFAILTGCESQTKEEISSTWVDIFEQKSSSRENICSAITKLKILLVLVADSFFILFYNTSCNKNFM